MATVREEFGGSEAGEPVEGGETDGEQTVLFLDVTRSGPLKPYHTQRRLPDMCSRHHCWIIRKRRPHSALADHKVPSRRRAKPTSGPQEDALLSAMKTHTTQLDTSALSQPSPGESVFGASRR
eukprot:264498_1